MVLVDSFSKFGQVIPCKTKTGLEVSEGLELLFSYIGPPKILHSDNGGEFKNPLMRSLCERWEIKQVHGRPKAPWVQGQCERLNQTLKRAMSKTANSKNTPSKWKNIYIGVVNMYINTYHSTTKKIPFEIFYRIGNRDLKIEDLMQGLLQFDPDNMSTD